MIHLLETFIAWLWNWTASRRKAAAFVGALVLGWALSDGRASATPVQIGQSKRMEHIAVLGKSGSGKSTLLRSAAKRDVDRDSGFVFFDLHGDSTPTILSFIAQREARTGEDLSQRTIVIEPADSEFSVGLNLLEWRSEQSSYVQIAEFAAILRQRWHLDSFGPRTEELLRNSLLALSEDNWTLLELPRLLTDPAFRAACVSKSSNVEVKEYFGSRYDRASEGMQAVYRDAILNKISAFTSDPRFRHVLGQRQSTFSLGEAIDRGCWVLLNLDKGRLGEQATTLGALFLTKLKNGLFARHSRKLFTLYCDEIQNLVVIDSSLDTLLAEARKFSASIVTANQFLDQYPPAMRSAILAVGTHVLFQLSSPDADRMAAAFSGGRSLADTLKNLPQRHMVVKSGSHRPIRAVVPELRSSRVATGDLYERCRKRWACRRSEVEAEIRSRAAQVGAEAGGLDGWT